MLLLGGTAVCAGGSPVAFDLPAGRLAETLEILGEQSGLQVVYAPGLLTGYRSAAVRGSMAIDEAVSHLLADLPVGWRIVSGHTLLLFPHERETPAALPATREVTAAAPAADGHARLSDIEVFARGDDYFLAEPSTSTFGFAIPPMRTPRSITAVGEDAIELLGLSAVEDLVRVVPGVYTPTRFGIQGAVDIRNVPADTYFRGMKRVNLQGHGRTVLAATDRIEVVRGPPSPLYGMGKIGGYTNTVPKSARAATGAYLTDSQGFARGVVGSHSRAELSAGIGGPLGAGDRRGGYYVYGLLEDSDSHTRHVPVGQKLLQAELTLDRGLGPFRLETGFGFQRSTTAGALLNRFNQVVVDTGRYVRGVPLVNLDLDRSGSIGFIDMHRASPVAGALSSTNQPLIQFWEWPVDAQGHHLPLGSFPEVRGIPATMYEYLQANPEHDPDGLLRAQGPGGPVPVSGRVPAGFALDPLTVGYDTLDLRRAGAWEREIGADFLLGYLDLVADDRPGRSFRLQLFADVMNQYKLSGQPGGGKQDVRVAEARLTRVREYPGLRPWLDVDVLLALNARHTRSSGYRYVGDQGTHRTDAMAGNGLPTPNSRFVHPFENDDVASGGAPWFADYRSAFSELGAGVLVDVTLRRRTDLLLGARQDFSGAGHVDRAGTVDPTVGTSADPGWVREFDRRARGSDSGTSWSASVSHAVSNGLRPYLTVAESSLTLDTNNNRMPPAVIERGHIGRARLVEAGLKGQSADGSLQFTLAGFRQERTGVTEQDEAAVLTAEVTSTRASGWEGELRWSPGQSVFVSAWAMHQRTVFSPNAGANVLVDARALGFADVLDEAGNVVYPAEAFLYGGRSFLVVPPGVESLQRRRGNPETQLGLFAIWRPDRHLGFTFSANHFSSVCSGRLCLVKLPSHGIMNVGAFVDSGPLHLRLDVFNVLNERHFRARTGDTLGDVMAQGMPGRRWQLTAQLRF